MFGDAQHILDKSDSGLFFRMLFRAYEKKVTRIVSIYIKNKEEVEELVSDVFVTLWQRRDKLKDITDTEAYIFILARNKALDRLKKKDRYISIEDVDTRLFDTYSSTPESDIISKETCRQLDDAIEDLPPKTKMAFMLVREQKLKYKDAATVMGTSRKTIEKQIASAVKKLLDFMVKLI